MKIVFSLRTLPRLALTVRMPSARLASRGLQAALAVAASAALAGPPVAAPPDGPEVIPSTAVAAQGGSQHGV